MSGAYLLSEFKISQPARYCRLAENLDTHDYRKLLLKLESLFGDKNVFDWHSVLFDGGSQRETFAIKINPEYTILEEDDKIRKENELRMYRRTLDDVSFHERMISIESKYSWRTKIMKMLREPEVQKLLDFFGYYVSSFDTVQNVVYFEPIFSRDINDKKKRYDKTEGSRILKSKYFYHITTADKAESILRKGLVARHGDGAVFLDLGWRDKPKSERYNELSSYSKRHGIPFRKLKEEDRLFYKDKDTRRRFIKEISRFYTDLEDAQAYRYFMKKVFVFGLGKPLERCDKRMVVGLAQSVIGYENLKEALYGINEPNFKRAPMRILKININETDKVSLMLRRDNAHELTGNDDSVIAYYTFSSIPPQFIEDITSTELLSKFFDN